MKIEPLAVRVSEAADALGVSRSTCYSLIATGQLRSIRVTKRGTRVPVEALQAFILHRQAEAAEEAPTTPKQSGDPLEGAAVRPLRSHASLSEPGLQA